MIHTTARPAIVPCLRHVPPFAALDDQQLARITACVVERPVTKGEMVTVQGQMGDTLYVVASGYFNRLTQSDIAGITGTVREVVGRALRELEHQGAITTERGRISVCDPDILQQVAAGGRTRTEDGVRAR